MLPTTPCLGTLDICIKVMRDGYHPIYALFLVQPSAIFSCKKCLTLFYSMYYNNKKVAIPLHFASHWSACQNFIRIQFEYMRYYTTCLPLLYNSHIHHSFCYPFLGSTQATYNIYSSVFYLSTFLHLLKSQLQVFSQPILYNGRFFNFV